MMINKIDRIGRSRNILIFGGNSGIGKSIAKTMLDDGACVTIVGRNKAKLENAKKELDNENLFINQMDISKVDSHLDYFHKAESLMGGLDAIVNSTLYILNSPGREFEPWDVTSEEWDNASETDFKAAFFIIRNAVDFFLENKVYGNILSISSINAYRDIIGIYGASKLSIARWTKAFGKRFGHDGIVINAIAPGSTFTPAISFHAKDIDQEFPTHAIDRFIKPDEIAELAKYCLSDKGVILCGSTIVADGGVCDSFL